MALTKADLAAIAALIDSKLAAAPVSKPATVAASSVRHIGPSGKPDGREHPCTATPPCGRLLRSAKSAASHDSSQPHWHGAA